MKIYYSLDELKAFGGYDVAELRRDGGYACAESEHHARIGRGLDLCRTEALLRDVLCA